MSQWIRFEDGRSRALPEHATILKDGRLIIKNELARKYGILPGKWVELFHNPETSSIALKVMDSPSPYALKISSTTQGGIDTFSQPCGKGKGYPNAVVGLRGFLNSRRIGLASKVKGEFFQDAEDPAFIVFRFATPPEVISATEHIQLQFEKKTGAEKVLGDVA